jgi:hypothetical protein
VGDKELARASLAVVRALSMSEEERRAIAEALAHVVDAGPFA